MGAGATTLDDLHAAARKAEEEIRSALYLACRRFTETTGGLFIQEVAVEMVDVTRMGDEFPQFEVAAVRVQAAIRLSRRGA